MRVPGQNLGSTEEEINYEELNSHESQTHARRTLDLTWLFLCQKVQRANRLATCASLNEVEYDIEELLRRSLAKFHISKRNAEADPTRTEFKNFCIFIGIKLNAFIVNETFSLRRPLKFFRFSLPPDEYTTKYVIMPHMCFQYSILM